MPLNVLIVDDSAVMRSMVGKTLRAAGLPIGEAFEAADGQQGLEVLDTEWVDVVFVDINMPVMGGVEMLEKLRMHPTWADLPVVVISTEGSSARIATIRALKAEFVHKPFSPETVRDVVTNLTGIPHEQKTG